MFIIALGLFVVGMLTLGLAVSLPMAQGLVFVLGILLVSAGLALPLHFGGTPKRPNNL